MPEIVKTVYFDRARGKGRNSAGKWVTVVKASDAVVVEEHLCERDARASIGLEGGSSDSAYRPKGTGAETTTEGDE